jgi:anti-sigma-K factor RskA
MSGEAARDMHALAAAYALDAVAPEEAVAFEEHLLTCAACTDEVRDMRETAARLGASTADEPPASLRSRVLDEAARTPQDGPVANRGVVDLADRRTTRSVVNAWLAGVAAAAVLVAGGLGISTYQASQRADEAQIAAEQIASLLADPGAVIERAEVAGGGTGTLVVAPDGAQAAFLTASLPNAGAGETYQLWAIDETEATSVGLLQPDAGRATALVALPAGTTTFGMTVEPAGGSPAPTTEPVLVVELSA